MTSDGKMSYKDFVFPVNPLIIKISHTKKINKNRVPFGYDIVSDMGSGYRIISGEGEFYGENCIDDFLKLKNVFENGGGGMLYLPSEKPIYAVFSSLESAAQDIEGVLKYKFEFIESFEKKIYPSSSYCISDGTVTLWDISYRYKKTVEALMKLNPSVCRPDYIIKRGERIILC